MTQPRRIFAVQRDGRNIEEVSIKGAINPGITYSQSFKEWEAAHEAGLDLYKWDTGAYPPFFMAKVLAWSELHNQVKMHQEDAVAKKMKPRRG